MYKEILTSSLKSILVNTRPDSLESISSLDKQITSGNSESKTKECANFKFEVKSSVK